MGIVSDADFDKEVSNLNKRTEVVIPEVLPMQRPGRSQGDTNVPDSLRKIIGETSEIDGRKEALELARHFGVSPSSVSAYANGSTSTATMEKTPNKPHINKAKERIASRAKRVAMRSLNYLTDEKLKDVKAVELAQIAKSMSGIVKDMEPEEGGGDDGSNKPQFIFYSPQIRDERHYEVTIARE